MNIEFFKNYLESQNYMIQTCNEKSYYLDAEGKIVATYCKQEETEVITVYFNDEKKQLRSHYNKIAFSIMENANEEQQIKIGGLLGVENDGIYKNGKLNFGENRELSDMTQNPDGFNQETLGSVGTVTVTEDANVELSLENYVIRGISQGKNEMGPIKLVPGQIVIDQAKKRSLTL